MPLNVVSTHRRISPVPKKHSGTLVLLLQWKSISGLGSSSTENHPGGFPAISGAVLCLFVLGTSWPLPLQATGGVSYPDIYHSASGSGPATVDWTCRGSCHMKKLEASESGHFISVVSAVSAVFRRPGHFLIVPAPGFVAPVHSASAVIWIVPPRLACHVVLGASQARTWIVVPRIPWAGL